jgi:hypothetical protein
MAKRWVHWNELDGIRSFHLELLLCFLIDREGPAMSIEEGLRRMFLFIARGLGQAITFEGAYQSGQDSPVVMTDPANPDNNVAARITEEERGELVSQAQRALETRTWAQGLPGRTETMDAWKEVFGGNFSIER